MKEASEDIRKELDSSISEANWMDAAAKLLTREKLRAMKIQTVHPEFYDNDSEFNKLYDGVRIITCNLIFNTRMSCTISIFVHIVRSRPGSF